MTQIRNVRITIYEKSTSIKANIEVWGSGTVPRLLKKVLRARSGPPTVDCLKRLVGSRFVDVKDSSELLKVTGKTVDRDLDMAQSSLS